MYVAKFTRKGLRVHVEIFEKRWSEVMLSNEISYISSKKFFFRYHAVRWMRAEIVGQVFKQHKLEIIDG